MAGPVFDTGVVRTRVIQSLSSIALSASASPQSEVDIPIQGDLVGVIVELTASATGTLTTPGTIDNALQSINIKDRFGNPIWQSIRGIDLNEFEFLQSWNVNQRGINTAVATTSGSSQTRRYWIPFRIDTAMFPCKLNMTLAPFSAMAASGATGGTVSVIVTGVFKDNAANNYTDRFVRLTQTIVSGTNRFAPNLPKGRIINNLAFTVGTESNVSNVTFSRDGSLELSQVTVGQLTALDQDLFISGHVTGVENLYNSAFLSTENTQLDVEGAGSDTLQWLIVLSEPLNN